ncbi:30S ribosome-binding factor RbfA [bacterium]|nr:30S ribosome-binding factor RbfA [bacterium]
MDGIKKSRAENNLLREISAVIREKVSDPDVGFVTLLRVKLSTDGRYAKVYYNALGDEKSHAKTDKALKRCAPYIQFEVASRTRMRVMPQLAFIFDKNLDYAMEMQKIFNQSSESQNKNDE